MNFNFDKKEYDSEKLSNEGKLYLQKLQNIIAQKQQLNIQFTDLEVLQKHYSELLIFAGVIAFPTGIAMTSNLGSTTVTAQGNTSVTGIAMTSALGTAQAFTDVVTEDVTGIAMSANLGSVAITGAANVSITGQAMTMQEDSVTIGADANVTVTALPMTAALGTAVADANSLIDVTGQIMTMQEGTATAPDSLAILTGIEMTMSLNSVKNVVWTEVNTGGAPIDPPGWKEVA